MKLVALLLALLWFPASASAAERMPAPTATVNYGACPYVQGVLGCADLATSTVWVLHRGDRFTRFHELGHVWDAQTLNGAQRAWFLRKIGRPGADWRAQIGEAKPGVVIPFRKAPPAELLAEAYAYCAMGYVPGGDPYVESVYGYQAIGAVKHHAICRWIKAIG